DDIRTLIIGETSNAGGRTVVAGLPGRTSHLRDEVLLELWLAGADIKWNSLLEEESYSKTLLPLYEFDRQRYWVETDHRAEQMVFTPEPENKAADELFFLEKTWNPLPACAENGRPIKGGVLILTNSSNRAKADGLIKYLPQIQPVVLEFGDKNLKLGEKSWR